MKKAHACFRKRGFHCIETVSPLTFIQCARLRLAERYWPGPLTLVLPGVPPGLESASKDDWIGVRFPAHTTTARFLASLDFPGKFGVFYENSRPTKNAKEQQWIDELRGKRGDNGSRDLMRKTFATLH